MDMIIGIAIGLAVGWLFFPKPQWFTDFVNKFMG